MSGKSLCSLLVAAALLAGVAGGGESPSVLMEKAIYTEETVGDLDAAIKLYEKVVSEAKAAETVGPGPVPPGPVPAEARQEGPGDRRLRGTRAAVPQATGPRGQGSEVPACEGRSEAAAHALGRWRGAAVHHVLAAGLPLGTMIYTVQSAELDGRKIWRSEEDHVRRRQRPAGSEPRGGRLRQLPPHQQHLPIPGPGRYLRRVQAQRSRHHDQAQRPGDKRASWNSTRSSTTTSRASRCFAVCRSSRSPR